MSPLAPSHNSNSNNTKTSSPGVSPDADADAAMMETETDDHCSVLSSPPRSATRRRINILFGGDDDDHDDDNDDDDTGNLLFGRRPTLRTPRNINGTNNGSSHRRLFPAEEPATATSAGAAKVKPATSPPFANTSFYRSELKPLNVDHNKRTQDHCAFFSSDQDNDDKNNTDKNDNNNNRPSLGASMSMDEADGRFGSAGASTRKRSSAERRPAAANLLSPRISPNSFLTMDGRFVQSKNPFSSPMMMDDDHCYHPHHTFSARATAGAPPLPDSFLRSTEAKLGLSMKHREESSLLLDDSPSGGGGDDDDDDDDMNSSLQPRKSPASPAGMFSVATTTMNNGGFPDHRYSFTGSPIQENGESSFAYNSRDTTPAETFALYGARNKTQGTSADSTISIMDNSISMDTASCGSLNKVRRLTLEDDIWSASGHAIRAAAQPPPPQHIDTNFFYGGSVASNMSDDGTAGNNANNNSNGGGGGGRGTAKNNKSSHEPHQHHYSGHGRHEDVSPTDVASFPFATATPATAKKQPPPLLGYGGFNYSSAVRPRTDTMPHPPTPVAERRRLAALAARTPHPGSILHSHRNRASPLATTTSSVSTVPKSRFHGDFDVISELGHGCFGTVYKVLSRLDGCMYAIKAAKRAARGEADKDRMLKEVYALSALSDQADPATFHIVRYHQAWMEEDRLYIQTELCQGSLSGEVAAIASSTGGGGCSGVIPLQRRWKLLREICLALAFLHRHEMCHLDIKPDNIFVKNDQFKLGDFGLVAKVAGHEDVEEGDSRYMSMELLAGDHADLTKSDIFSLGATVYETSLGGRQQLPANGPQWQELRSGQVAPTLQQHHVDAELVQILEQMMRPDYQQRPSATDLLQRPQLLSDDQKALNAERSKVAAANLALQQYQLRSPPPFPLGKKLQRANTWGGNSMNLNF